MTRCRSCSAENPERNRFCGVCGAALATEAHTQTMPEAKTPGPPESYDEGRFRAGAVLAGRYRIIGLLGKGGMGEVYRANDLRLGQPVALKFLAAASEMNSQLLARFHSEVRIARQVSHPNVCRVYDIAEADGSTFLSMEYVDGEDLRSLLRRIGRLPGDKAIEIARKLCAGLAAAHDKGVLHRDLKPANIMIDGRGQVLITDFGLAAIAGQLQPAQLRDGTPAYMAPEQLEGKEVSVRSDLYALGLVLHEMFTGKPAFEDGSCERVTPKAVSSLTKDFDPLVDRVILRCLDVDPRKRPASALAVAAALPGGDPLAAALAAGETPTPAMVAAAGDAGEISVKTAGLCLAWIVMGLVVLIILGGRTNVLDRTPFPNSPEILAQKARETIRSFGYDAPTADRAYGFSYDTAYQAYAAQGKPAAYRDRLTKGQPPLIYFWYRQSPQPLVVSDALTGTISRWDPPPLISGMIGLTLDPQGRLLQFDAVPPQVEERPSAPAPYNWQALFTAAGLDLSRFTSAEPQWISLAPFDWRAAWTGSYAEAPEIPIRIEAASWSGKPVFFKVIGPWSKPERMQPSEGVRLGVGVFLLAVLALGAYLAWRNLQAKRGDMHGANRAAAFVFIVECLGLLLSAHHVTAADEGRVLLSGAVDASIVAGIVWALYLAIEPYVRRRWPQSMISWGRVLSGGIRDPLVGAHLLFGVAAGIGLAIIHAGTQVAVQHYGKIYGQAFLGSYSLDTRLSFLDARGWRAASC